MSLTHTQKKLSAAFEDITAATMELLDLYEVDADIVSDVGETLVSVYAKHLGVDPTAGRRR